MVTTPVALSLLKYVRAQVALKFDFRPSGDVTRFLPTRAKLLATPAWTRRSTATCPSFRPCTGAWTRTEPLDGSSRQAR